MSPMITQRSRSRALRVARFSRRTDSDCFRLNSRVVRPPGNAASRDGMQDAFGALERFLTNAVQLGYRNIPVAACFGVLSCSLSNIAVAEGLTRTRSGARQCNASRAG